MQVLPQSNEAQVTKLKARLPHTIGAHRTLSCGRLVTLLMRAPLATPTSAHSDR